MRRDDAIYQAYVEILREELVPAMGCTEPISIAYAAAYARKTLGALPTYVKVEVSRNIIKNVKSVVVPNTGQKKGIAVAAAVGIVAGDPDKKLEVIASVTDSQRAELTKYLATATIETQQIDSPNIFDIRITVSAGCEQVMVRIVGDHANIVQVYRGEEKLVDLPCLEEKKKNGTDHSLLTVERIVEFADTVHIADVVPIIKRQINYNWAIANEGMCNTYGANIGKTLRATLGEAVCNRACYMAAAGSDARMSGCELPVIINSGSGNQGMTASVPVIVYAQELHADEERLIRALVVSNLCAIHQKTGIGTLSAYCGAVSAGCGAGAGIAYLHGEKYDGIKHTLVNAMAISSGMICDGAKPSCAGKIAAAVYVGILGYHMYLQGNQFYAGEGIVKQGVEKTIAAVGVLASKGMAVTDKIVTELMTQE